MKLLALVHNIDVVVRLEIFLSLNDCCKVRSRIESGSVGFSHDTRRKLLRIGRLRDIDNKSTLALVSKSLILKILDQSRDIRLRVALPFPEIKINIEICIVSLQIP